MVAPAPTPKITIAQSALDLIAHESTRFSAEHAVTHDQETGGIMIGKRVAPGHVVVVAASGPGPRADHRQFEFGLDADYANAELQRWIKRDSALDFIGVWHKHPSSLDRPSSGDVQSAHALFADKDYHNVELVNPIVTVRRGLPNVKIYYMSREDAQQRRGFRFVEYQVEPDTSLIFSPGQQPTSNATYAMANDSSWYLRHPDRFKREYDALQERSATVSIAELDKGEQVFTVALKGNPTTVVYLITSSNYPSIVPHVLIEDHGQPVEFQLMALVSWSSTSSLANIVDEIQNVLSLKPTFTPEKKPSLTLAAKDQPALVEQVRRPISKQIGWIAAGATILSFAIVIKARRERASKG